MAKTKPVKEIPKRYSKTAEEINNMTSSQDVPGYVIDAVNALLKPYNVSIKASQGKRGNVIIDVTGMTCKKREEAILDKMKYNKSERTHFNMGRYQAAGALSDGIESNIFMFWQEQHGNNNPESLRGMEEELSFWT